MALSVDYGDKIEALYFNIILKMISGQASLAIIKNRCKLISGGHPIFLKNVNIACCGPACGWSRVTGAHNSSAA